MSSDNDFTAMISDNVNVDGLAHMETDGLPDPLTEPSAEKVFL